MKTSTRFLLSISAGLPVLCPFTQTAAQGVNSLRFWTATPGASETGPYKAVSAGLGYTIAIVSSTDPLLDSRLAGWGTVIGTQIYGPPLSGSCEGCPPPPAPGTKVKSISAGRAHMAAILEDDTAYCWGDGGLMAGTIITAPPGVRFKMVSAGEGFTAGIVLDPGGPDDGKLRIWGGNYAFTSECGSDPKAPVVPPSGTFTSISAGGHHLLAIDTNGNVVGIQSTCNIYQFGQGASQTGTFLAVAAGHFHSLALKSDWTLLKWGGEPGHPIQTNSVPPGQFTAIASGYRYGMALRGYGSIGTRIETLGCLPQIGCSTPTPPVPPPGPPQLEYGKISAGYYHAVGVINCYGNCDGSAVAPVFNVLDFLCFQNRFASGDPWANCDGSTTPPILNVLDFGCFNNKFVACVGGE